MAEPGELGRLALARLATDVDGVEPDAFRALFLLAGAWARIERDLERAVHRPRGLSWGGFRLLFCLWAAGPLETRELARMLSTTTATVSSVVKTLEGRGWVRRERHAADQRRVTVQLTAAGTRVAQGAVRGQHQREQAWTEGIAPDDLHTLISVLGDLITRPRPGADAVAQ